jgi:hypothetical protein
MCLISSIGAVPTHIITMPLDSENLMFHAPISLNPVGIGWPLKAFLSMTNSEAVGHLAA